MIPITEIYSRAEHFNIPIDTIEKDYIISWILQCFSRTKLGKDFVFYGGTAIKKIYFDDHRFSEDIDLIGAEIYDPDIVINEMDALEYAHEKANIILTIDKEKISIGRGRLQFYIDYTGYDEIVGAQKSIKVDIVTGEKIDSDCIERNIIKSYSDTEINDEKNLKVMALNTILANKLGMIFDSTRYEPRDIYDVWFLLNRTDQFDFNYSRIKEIHKTKYNIYPSVREISSCLKNPAYKINWETRLSKQIALLPDFVQVIQYIKLSLEKLENTPIGAG